MKVKLKKILIILLVVISICFIGIKVLGFQFAGPSEFGIIRDNK